VCNGGGGIRTPVPRHFRTSFYMLSRSIKASPCRLPNDRLPVRLFRNQIRSYVPNTRKDYPAVRRPCRGHRKNPAGRAALITQPFATDSCQLNLCRMISQANRRPEHATCPSTCPVEAVRPLYTLFKKPLLQHYTTTYIKRQEQWVCPDMVMASLALFFCLFILCALGGLTSFCAFSWPFTGRCCA